jgi:hypothetical protein
MLTCLLQLGLRLRGERQQGKPHRADRNGETAPELHRFLP